MTPAAPASDRRIMIRAAVTADQDAVCAVLVAAYEQYRTDVNSRLHALYIADLCDLDHRLPGAQLLVATEDEVVVGTVTLHQRMVDGEFRWPSGWAAIRALAVDPDHRGHGVARRLIEVASILAAGGSAHTLGLHTAPFMTDAIRLYERMGFGRAPDLDIDATSLLDTNGETAPRVIAYQRPLQPGQPTRPHH